MTKPGETFHFKPSIQEKGDWMLGLVDLEAYSSIFNITQENNKFELYKFLDSKIGGSSYQKVRDEIEKDLGISDITTADLQDDIIAPNNIDEYREQVTQRLKDDKYMLILSGYTSSMFHDFESFLKTEVDLLEHDIKLVLDEYKSSFSTCEISPGIYTCRDITEFLLGSLQPEYEGHYNAIDIELDDINKKIKLFVRPVIIAIRFDEKSFFNTVLGFNPGWDYKHFKEKTSQKIVNLNSTIKIHLKSDDIDGSVVNSFRQPILFSFVLDKQSGYKVFCELETIHFKKKNKSVLNTITFYLEDDNNEEVNFNGETLTFTLQMVKI